MIKFKIFSCEIPSTIFKITSSGLQAADEESIKYYRFFSLLCDKGTEDNLIKLKWSVSAELGLSFSFS